MARGVTYVVYVLPVVFSVIFGTIVMVDVLQEPGRELNLLRFGSFELPSTSNEMEIIGLENQYSVSEPVQIQVMVNDESFSCGDLYVTIYPSGSQNAVSQSGYFNQCFNENNPFLPNTERFSEVIDTPGNYEIVADMLDENQENSITTSEKFIVK